MTNPYVTCKIASPAKIKLSYPIELLMFAHFNINTINIMQIQIFLRSFNCTNSKQNRKIKEKKFALGLRHFYTLNDNKENKMNSFLKNIFVKTHFVLLKLLASLKVIL